MNELYYCAHCKVWFYDDELHIQSVDATHYEPSYVEWLHDICRTDDIHTFEEEIREPYCTCCHEDPDGDIAIEDGKLIHDDGECGHEVICFQNYDPTPYDPADVTSPSSASERFSTMVRALP